MNGIRSIAAAIAIAVAALGAATTSGAHPGHAPAIITIDRPAAGTLYTNDVQQPGSIQQIGNVVNPAASIGDKLTITVSWKCPPQSTGASVNTTVKDANGATVHDSGLLAGAPAGSSSTTWNAKANGTYTITSTVKCHHFENDPRTGKITKVDDGTDTDTRTVVAFRKHRSHGARELGSGAGFRARICYRARVYVRASASTFALATGAGLTTRASGVAARSRRVRRSGRQPSSGCSEG